MASSKKSLELDSRVQDIIDEEFKEFAIYLHTPQERAMYDRKRKEYWTKINARIKESNLTDGRTADDPAGK